MISDCGQLGVDYRRFDDRATFPGLCSAKTSSELVTDAKRAGYLIISFRSADDVLEFSCVPFATTATKNLSSAFLVRHVILFPPQESRDKESIFVRTLDHVSK